MTANDLFEQLQTLSDTPLRVIGRTPGRLTALGGLAGGTAELATRLAPFGAELVEQAHGNTLHRLDELSTVVLCTSFGGLLIQQVPDVERFIAGYLRDSAREQEQTA